MVSTDNQTLDTATPTATDDKYALRQELAKPLGTLIHHMFSHSGVLPKLESKEENTARREKIIQQVEAMVHERPAKGALNLLIEQNGKDHVPSLLHLSHEFYEGLGEDQTRKIMKLSGLDVEHLRKSADVEHVLANINNVVISANPAMMNSLLQETAGKSEGVKAAAGENSPNAPKPAEKPRAATPQRKEFKSLEDTPINLESLINVESSAALRRVDLTQAADGSHFMFFQGRKNVPVEDFMDILQESLPEENFISTTVVDDKPIIVARTHSDPQALLSKWQERTGQGFKPYEAEKPKKSRDLIKIRGTVGNIGQLFMIASGFLDSEGKGKFDFKKNPDAAAKITSAVISVFGNGINSYYGVQRNTDDTRLRHAKGLVNQSLGMGNNALTGNLPSKYTRITRLKTEDQPTWMEKNSIKVSNGVKFFGKAALTMANDKNLKLSGQLSLAAKVVTLLGMDEDPHKLEKDQGLWARIRRQSNAISGVLEWVANISLFSGSLFKVPKDAKSSRFTLYNFDDAVRRPFKDIQWWQMLGAGSFFVSLTAKALAPFTNKKLDVEELTTHSTIALVESIPQGKHTDELTRLTAQLLETRELPELKKQGFATTFTEIANRLEKFHGIAIDSPTPSSNTQALEHYAKQENTPATEAEKRPSIAASIAKEPRPETMAERVDAQKTTLQPQAGV